jgi:hypothetical protein
LLWVGLKAYVAGDKFVLSAPPFNLVTPECCGFEVLPFAIRHQFDAYRQHYLAFDVGGAIRRFAWSRKGFFLESFMRTAGRAIQPVPQQLGDTFSASVDSQRWLRVWCVPAISAHLMVNGQILQSMKSGQNRAFFDVSLAQVSTLYPQGGRIVLKRDDTETAVAEFARPLTPDRVQFNVFYEFKSVKFLFREQVQWVRPHLLDLVTGKTVEFAGQELLESEEGVFCSGDLPKLQCFLTTPAEDLQCKSAIELLVPKCDWPQGLWLVELQVSRDEASDWQLVTDSAGRRVPVVVRGEVGGTTAASPPELLTDCEKECDTAPHTQEEATNEKHHILVQAFSNVLQVLQNGFVPELQGEFRWLEDTVGQSAQTLTRELDKLSRADINKQVPGATRASLQGGFDEFAGRGLSMSPPQLAPWQQWGEGRLDVPDNLHHAFETAKDIVAARVQWNQLGHRPPSLRDYHGLPRSSNLVHDFQAARLELPRRHRFHGCLPPFMVTL